MQLAVLQGARAQAHGNSSMSGSPPKLQGVFPIRPLPFATSAPQPMLALCHLAPLPILQMAQHQIGVLPHHTAPLSPVSSPPTS